MDDFKKLTEQLMKIYSNAESVNDLGIENYFDENISLIGTGKHEIFRNLHEFLESFEFDVKQRGKIRIEVQNLHQEEEQLDDDHVLAHGTVDFIGLFKDGSICFKMETRFTIIYRWINGKWLVQHLHQSTPDLEQRDGEEFPVTLGKQVKRTRQAFHALGTAYYHISRLNLKTKKVELVKRSRKMDWDIKDNTADWDLQFEGIEGIIAEPFVQKYIDFFDIQTMAARLHNKESMSSEFKKKNGSWFLSMVVPQSYDKNGNVTSVLIANRDVTDEKMRELKQEEELREAKLKAECANKAKSSFLFNMSHDIRTPMNAIIGLNSMIRSSLDDREQVLDYTEKLDSASQYLLALLNDILDMSRIESGSMKLAIRAFEGDKFWDNVNMLAKAQAVMAGVGYSFERRKKISEVYIGDSTRLEQIMVNLINNAVKFTPKGGNVNVSVAEQETDGRVQLTAVVSDNGIGIAKDFLPKVFEIFTQEHEENTRVYGGSGLGLSIARNYARMMDGDITVESAEGKGTVFTVTAKLDFDRRKKARKERTENISFEGKRILLVEDHPLNVIVAKGLLEKKQFEVVTAENGKKAVELVTDAPEYYFDAILMDIRMPVLDGIEAARQIRALDRADVKELPIIAMTANAGDEDRRQTKEAGMNEHLAKPIDPKLLYTTLQKFILP